MRRSTIIALMTVLWLSGCLSDEEYSLEEVETLMQETLEERVDNFRKVHQERCREELIAQAIVMADSIMLVRSRESLREPGRPERPERPPARKPKDSLDVKPLFRRDTLVPHPDTLPAKPDSIRRRE